MAAIILYSFIHHQVCGVFIICLGNLNRGALLGYSTTALPQWKSEKNIALNLDDNECSFFASLFWIVGIICSPIGGILSGWLGRRKIVILSAPVVASGWLIIGLAQSKNMLYAGRIITSGIKGI